MLLLLWILANALNKTVKEDNPMIINKMTMTMTVTVTKMKIYSVRIQAADTFAINTWWLSSLIKSKWQIECNCQIDIYQFIFLTDGIFMHSQMDFVYLFAVVVAVFYIKISIKPASLLVVGAYNFSWDCVCFLVAFGISSKLTPSWLWHDGAGGGI